MVLLDEGKGKTKILFCLLETRKPKHGGLFHKNNPPHHRREICAKYLYMENSLLKIDHKIVHEWVNYVLTPIHTVAIKPIHTVSIMKNRTNLQGCANVVHTSTQITKQQCTTYEGGGKWKSFRKKYGQMCSCYPNELKKRLTHGRLSYLR